MERFATLSLDYRPPSELTPCLPALQMAELIGDFLRSPGIDPLVEEHFRAFLARQRIRCAHADVQGMPAGHAPVRQLVLPSWFRCLIVRDTLPVSGAHFCKSHAFWDAKPPSNNIIRGQRGRPLLPLSTIANSCRSFPRLETALDWLLQLYWIILPIVVR